MELLKGIRICFLPFVAFCLFAQVSEAQDTLVTRKEERILAKILEIGITEISYRKTDYPDGPLYKMEKKEVKCIRYKNGSVDTFSLEQVEPPAVEVSEPTPFAPPPKKLTYRDGFVDAEQYYRGYKAAGALSFASGLFLFYGLPIPVVSSLVRPVNVANYVPDIKEYRTNPDYAAGFNRKAFSMKKSKVWANYGYGAGTIFALALILIASQ